MRLIVIGMVMQRYEGAGRGCTPTIYHSDCQTLASHIKLQENALHHPLIVV